MVTLTTPSVSFEFFPPANEAKEQALRETISQLEALHPTFVSVTYGAGGSTRDRTINVTRYIANSTSLTPMAHMTCVNATRQAVHGVVQDLLDAGVTAIMALRGDPPGGVNQPWEATQHGFAHASELVQAIRDWEDPNQPCTIGVAAFPEGHPESPSLDEDARWLAHKLAVGADFAITQMFFEAHLWEDLRDRVAGHGQTKPIIPGIMPIASSSQLHRMAQLSGGTIPAELTRKIEEAETKGTVKELGIELATELAQTLLDRGAPGVHLYTLNDASASMAIVQALGLTR